MTVDRLQQPIVPGLDCQHKQVIKMLQDANSCTTKQGAPLTQYSTPSDPHATLMVNKHNKTPCPTLSFKITEHDIHPILLKFCMHALQNMPDAQSLLTRYWVACCSNTCLNKHMYSTIGMATCARYWNWNWITVMGSGLYCYQLYHDSTPMKGPPMRGMSIRARHAQSCHLNNG